MNDLGLRKSDLEVINAILSQFTQVSQAYIFGSRAKGNFENGSDVDIALKGESLNLEVISKISYKLNEESSLPYMFDLLNYHTLTNLELKAHIDRVGVLVFTK